MSGKTGGRVEGIIRKEIRFCVSSVEGSCDEMRMYG